MLRRPEAREISAESRSVGTSGNWMWHRTQSSESRRDQRNAEGTMAVVDWWGWMDLDFQEGSLRPKVYSSGRADAKGGALRSPRIPRRPLCPRQHFAARKS